LNPDGSKVVMPAIRPDFKPVSVELLKLVAASTVAPNRSAKFKLHSVNTVPDKFVDRKSIDVSVSRVNVAPLPTTMIVINVTVKSKKLVVAAIYELAVVFPIPFTVTVPVFDDVETVATLLLLDVWVTVHVSVVSVLMRLDGMDNVELRTYFV